MNIFVTYFLYLDSFLPPFLFWLPYFFLIAIILFASLTMIFAPSRRSMGQWTPISSNTLATSSSRLPTHDSSSRQHLLSMLTGETATETSNLISSFTPVGESCSLDLCPTCVLDKSLTSTHCSVCYFPFLPTPSHLSFSSCHLYITPLDL